MLGRQTRLIICLIVLALVSGRAIAQPITPSPDINPIPYAATLVGAPERDLQVVNEALARYPLSHQVLTVYKILDSRTGLIWRVGMDSSQTWTQAVEDYAAAETALYQREYSRLTPALKGRLQETTAEANIAVAIWATVPVKLFQVFLPITTRALAGTQPGESIPDSSATPVDPQQSVVQYLQTLGYQPLYVSDYTPIVYASLPASVITGLAMQASVAYIDVAQQQQLHLYSAARTIAAPWTWSRGFTGQGVIVGVVEGDGVDFGHSSLAGSTTDAWRYFRPGTPNFGAYPLNHATEVAGVIASTDATNRGIADSATILSGNSGSMWDWDLQAAAEWAIAQGADILNFSWGSDTSRDLSNTDRWVDWLTWNNHVTIVVSAGNSDHGANVGSPAKGFNVLAVGAKDDKNTAASESDVCDDVMSSFSAYLDPHSTFGDRQKPEVVAVGERLVTTDVQNGWTSSVAGTSFAAPQVAGQSALMMSRVAWLKSAPETVRAVIMASARWNVEGSRRLSDKDGAGGVDVTAADNSLLNNRMSLLSLTKNDLPRDISFQVTVPERIRVAIAWNSHPTGGSWWQFWQTDPLKADLDLTIYAPDGSLVTGSYSFDNSYEIVEFAASQTGNYKARISQTRWDSDNPRERVGFGWYSGANLLAGCP